MHFYFNSIANHWDVIIILNMIVIEYFISDPETTWNWHTQKWQNRMPNIVR